jgi:hypothetical protein
MSGARLVRRGDRVLASTTSFLEHLKWLRKAALAGRADLLVAGDSLQALVRHGGRHWALHPLFLSAGGAQVSAALRDDADAFAGWLPYPRDRRWPIAEDALAFHGFASSAGLRLARVEPAATPVAGEHVTTWFWSGAPVCSELGARRSAAGAGERAAKGAADWTALMRDAGRTLLAGVPEHLRAGTLFTVEAVLDADAQPALLGMRCNPIVHPLVYPAMLESLLAEGRQATQETIGAPT